MGIEELITRDDLIKVAKKEKAKSERYKDSSDLIGHQMYMMTNYACDVILNNFGISNNKLDFKGYEKQLYLDLDGYD